MVKRAARAYNEELDNVGELSNIAHLKAGQTGFNATDAVIETYGGASSVADYGITAV